MFLLIVTWFYYGQPPATTQSQFTSKEKCEIARDFVFADAERLKKEAYEEARKPQPGITVLSVNPIFPTVSAVCVAQ
jgi:hypothetical protein